VARGKNNGGERIVRKRSGRAGKKRAAGERVRRKKKKTGGKNARGWWPKKKGGPCGGGQKMAHDKGGERVTRFGMQKPPQETKVTRKQQNGETHEHRTSGKGGWLERVKLS